MDTISVQNAILKRHSTRDFCPDALSEAELQVLEAAALAAPTAMNRQELRFCFILSQDLRAEICRAFLEGGISETMKARFAEIGKQDIFYNAPLLVLIAAGEAKWADVDAGIAVQNLALAAEGLGLASCIIGCIDGILKEPGEAADAFRRRLGLQEGESFRIAIAIGRGAKSKAPHQGSAEQIRRIGG